MFRSVQVPTTPSAEEPPSNTTAVPAVEPATRLAARSRNGVSTYIDRIDRASEKEAIPRCHVPNRRDHATARMA